MTYRFFRAFCLPLTLVSFILMTLTACTEQVDQEQAAAPQQMPPMPVEVAQVVVTPLSEAKVYSGLLQAAQQVNLIPQVSGHIKSVEFDEGSVVEQGEVLFMIDSRSFEAELKRLRAQLKSFEAQIELAKRDVERAESLRTKNAISQEQLDNRNTQLTKSIADADSLRAAIDVAKLNLSYCTVTSPINGVISRAFTTRGNFVTSGETVMTEIVSNDIFYAYFAVDEAIYSKLRNVSQDKLENVVLMNLVGEYDYPHKGRIDFVDNKIDRSTGTIRLRAAFENVDGKFTSGSFVRLNVRVSEQAEAVLVRETAISTDLSNKYVLVVGEGNVLEYRPIKLGARVGNLRAVESGLAAGEKIVINGLKRVWPGIPVDPQISEMISAEALEQIVQKQAILASDPAAIKHSAE
jgi:membrane fusion protein, multidrug efflux system